MQLEYEFTVPVPASHAWTVLLDLERVVPCLPGAALTSYDGEAFAGTVRVKLGPVNLTYQGKGRFVARDEDAGRVVIEASGREARGAGTAAATATMTLRSTADAASTIVTVSADLSVTGRPAQFGRGMIADVGGRLVSQFADCLGERLAESEPPAADVAANAAGGATAAGEGSAPAPAVDLLRVAVGPALRRVGPYAIGILAAALVVRTLRRRRRARQQLR
jgi:carbon monoxide dehydrogenase subunit G